MPRYPVQRREWTRGLAAALVFTAATLSLAQNKAQNKAAAQKWATFKSRSVQSYTIEYPADWHIIRGTSELDVLNYEPETGDLGILFHPEGHFGASPEEIAAEAELGVNAHPPDVRSVDEWMIQELRDEVIDKDEKIPLARPAANGCLQLRRVLGTNEINGNVFVDAYYYCTTRIGLFEIVMTNRRNNLHQEELQALAMKAALSLRVL